MVTPSRYVTICYTYCNRCVPEIAPFCNHYHRNHLYNPFVTIEKCRIPHKTAGYVKKPAGYAEIMVTSTISVTMLYNWLRVTIICITIQNRNGYVLVLWNGYRLIIFCNHYYFYYKWYPRNHYYCFRNHWLSNHCIV